MATGTTAASLLQRARTPSAVAASATPAPAPASTAGAVAPVPVAPSASATQLMDAANRASNLTGAQLRTAVTQQEQSRDPRFAFLQRFGAAPAEAGLHTPEDVTKALTADLPPAIQSLVRAFGSEILEPTLRAGGPGLTGLTTQASVPERLLDAAQVGFAATPLGRGVTTAVIGTQAALDAATGNPNLARALALAGTAALTGVQAVRAVARGVSSAKSTAKGLLSQARDIPSAATAARVPRAEIVGSRVQELASKALAGRKVVSQRMLDSAENAIVSAAPRSPVAQLKGAFDDLSTASVRPLGTEAQTAWTNVKTALETGSDAATADLVTLRTALAKRSGYGVDTRFSSLSDSQELVKNFRQGIADTLESIAPQRYAENYKAARLNYRVNYIQQRDAVRGLLDMNVTPKQAFERVFNPNDTQAMRTVTELTNASPKLALATRGKLRQGFIEGLADDAGNVLDPRATRELFEGRKNAMIASGTFSPDEIRTLDRFLQAESLPRLKSAVDLLIPGKGGNARRLVPAAFGLALAFKPMHTLAVIGASGALMEFRRLQLLAPNTPEAAKLVGFIATKVDDYARTLATMQDHTNRGKASIED